MTYRPLNIVMPTQAGIYDFLLSQTRKSWMPAFAGMTGSPGHRAFRHSESWIPAFAGMTGWVGR